jgi:hypothetical protein
VRPACAESRRWTQGSTALALAHASYGSHAAQVCTKCIDEWKSEDWPAFVRYALVVHSIKDPEVDKCLKALVALTDSDRENLSPHRWFSQNTQFWQQHGLTSKAQQAINAELASVHQRHRKCSVM